jgi:hypothetical protein
MISATYGEGWTSRVTGVRTDRRLEADDRTLDDRGAVRVVSRKVHQSRPLEPLGDESAGQTAMTSTSPWRWWKSSGLRV